MKMNLRTSSRKRRHKISISEYILKLEFECNTLRRQLKSVDDKTLIKKIIFKTQLQNKYAKRLKLLNF